MRVVSDTNNVVSGLFWSGPPRQVLKAARSGLIQLFSSSALLAELADVLGRKKFKRYIDSAGVRLEDLIADYSHLVTVVSPESVKAVVDGDPDDDEVLACAVTANADRVVSGDHHLLDLGKYGGINIVSARELVDEVNKAHQSGTE